MIQRIAGLAFGAAVLLYLSRFRPWQLRWGATRRSRHGADRTDELIHLEIKTSLDQHFPLENLDVTVDQGAAILRGTVASYRMQQDAEHLAWATTVKTVTNKILIG